MYCSWKQHGDVLGLINLDHKSFFGLAFISLFKLFFLKLLFAWNKFDLLLTKIKFKEQVNSKPNLFNYSPTQGDGGFISVNF